MIRMHSRTFKIRQDSAACVSLSSDSIVKERRINQQQTPDSAGFPAYRRENENSFRTFPESLAPVQEIAVFRH